MIVDDLEAGLIRGPMVKMAASDDDSRSEVSEILASCDNTSPKKKEADNNSETSSDPFEVKKT